MEFDYSDLHELAEPVHKALLDKGASVHSAWLANVTGLERGDVLDALQSLMDAGLVTKYGSAGGGQGGRWYAKSESGSEPNKTKTERLADRHDPLCMPLILEALEKTAMPMQLANLVTATGYTDSSVSEGLRRLLKQGKVKRVRRGVYALPEHADKRAPMHNPAHPKPARMEPPAHTPAKVQQQDGLHTAISAIDTEIAQLDARLEKLRITRETLLELAA